MPALSRILIIVAVLVVALFHVNCMGSAPDKLGMKFVEKCQMGDWAAAESYLSSTGKMLYQEKSLEDSMWPMLGMAAKCGMDTELIKTKLDSAIILVANDTQSTRGEIRIKVNNTMIVGEGPQSIIRGAIGLDTIDVQIVIKIVQESNRWKIERIAPQVSESDKLLWEQLASKSPGSLGISVE